MILAVSNIAWGPDLAHSAYKVMRAHGVSGLEIAPGLTFAGETDVLLPSARALAAFRGDLAEFGLKVVSMQSLLFGVSGARIFGTPDELAHFEATMHRAIALAEALESPNLVFGSPKNRAFPSGMNEQEVVRHSSAVFRRLGERALAAGTVLSLEPVAAAYGTNFLTTVEQAARYVAALDHPGVTMTYDLGALYANREDERAGEIYDLAAGRVSHVQISEPELAPSPANPAQLARQAATLLSRGYEGWFSLEMRAPPSNVIDRVERSLARAVGAMAAARQMIAAGPEASI